MTISRKSAGTGRASMLSWNSRANARSTGSLSSGTAAAGSRITGLAGHDRAAPMRTIPNVRSGWPTIRSALGKLEGEHGRLARHLRNAVRTGTWRVYEPETPVEWEL